MNFTTPEFVLFFLGFLWIFYRIKPSRTLTAIEYSERDHGDAQQECLNQGDSSQSNSKPCVISCFTTATGAVPLQRNVYYYAI